MCSGSEAGSHLRRIDFMYHSTLGLRVMMMMKKKKKKNYQQPGVNQIREMKRFLGVGSAHSSKSLGI